MVYFSASAQQKAPAHQSAPEKAVRSVLVCFHQVLLQLVKLAESRTGNHEAPLENAPTVQDSLSEAF